MKHILLILSFFLASLSLVAQSEDWTYYYSMENINDFAEADDFMWFATDHGVVKMDKQTLEKTYFTTANSNLPDAHIQSIVIGAQGLPWIGTYDIIMARFDGEDWTDIVKIPEMDSLGGSFSNWNPTLYRMKVGPDGMMWLGTNDGLVRFDGNQAHVFNGNNVEAGFFHDVWDITFDEAGSVYASSFELFKYDTLGNWTNYTEDYPELVSYGGSSLHYCSADSTIWYHNSFGSLAGLKEDEWTIYEFFNNDHWDPSPPSTLTYFSEDAAGELIICSPGNGLYQRQDSVWAKFTTPQTEANGNQMTHYYIDQEGRSWLINKGYVSRSEGEELSDVYVSEYPFFTNRFTKITGDREGNVYIIENSSNVVKYNEEEGMTVFDEFREGYEDETNYIWDINFTEFGEKWIGANSRLFHHDGEAWQLHTNFDSVGFYGGYGIHLNANGHMVIPSYKKLLRFDGEDWEVFNSENSALIDDFPAHSAVIDQNNVVWAAGNDWVNSNFTYRIYRLEGDDWQVWYPSHTDIPEDAYIAEMFVDRDNNIWFGTYYKGIYRYDGQNWTHFDDELLEEASITAIFQDTEGLMYFSTYEGLFILDGDEWMSFTTENAPLLGNHISSVYKDDMGKLWMASYNEGINVYDVVTALEQTEVFERPSLSVYPNPARAFVTAEFQNDASQKGSFITLSNLNGQQISTFSLDKYNAGHQRVSVPVSNLPEGIYILSVISDQEIRTAKVVVK